MIKNFSDRDKKDWEDFISRKEKLHDKDAISFSDSKIKTKLIDLHGYSLEKANKIIENFISASYIEGAKKLIIITGKGLHSENEKNPYVSKDLSILKYSVPEFIMGNKKLMRLIVKLEDAKIEDGGSGAFYVYLKKHKKK